MRVILFDEVRNTLDFFSELLKIEFEKRGDEVFMVHMNHFEERKAEFIQFLSIKPDLVICYNNAAFSLEVIPGKSFWDTLGTPVVNILFDHPGAYWNILEKAPEVCIPACVDRNHITFLERFIPNLQPGVFMPHGGLELPGEVIPWAERKTDVLYVGKPSYKVYEEDFLAEKIMNFLKENMSYTVEAAVEAIINQFSIEELNNIFPNIKICLESLGLYSQGLDACDIEALERESYIEEALRKYNYLHEYLTSGHRRMLIKQLVEAGIDVTVYGNWENEKDLLANPHFHFGGYITPMECVEKMRDSKIVLNSMPWFKDGNHDRICHGMLQKAVVVTETSKYIEERFTDRKELRLFTLEQLEAGDIVPNIVKEVLNDEKKAVEIAENGYACAKAYDTMKSRVDDLLLDLGF